MLGYGVAREARAARNAGERGLPAPTPISREYVLLRACQSVSGFEQGHAWMHEACSAGLPGVSPSIALTSRCIWGYG